MTRPTNLPELHPAIRITHEGTTIGECLKVVAEAAACNRGLRFLNLFVRNSAGADEPLFRMDSYWEIVDETDSGSGAK